MDYLNLYCKTVIQPLESKRNEIRKKYYSSIFFKKRYKRLLDIVEDELFSKYQKLEAMMKYEI